MSAANHRVSATARAIALRRSAWRNLPEGMPRLGPALGRQLAGLLLVGAFLWALRDRLAMLDLSALPATLASLAAGHWAGAMAATALGFAALARYDALIHRALGTGAAPAQARRAGWTAIALSQAIGFGLVSGALVRWRMLPDLSLVQATKITATVAASFLAAWAVLSAHVLLVLPVDHLGLHLGTAQGFAGLGLVLGGGLGLAALVSPRLRLGGRELRLPPLPVMARILALAALDTGLAALALWLLLPPGTDLGFLALLPAFLLALGAGFVAGTPGGIGPFEITLVALLPGTDPAALLGGVLAWRLVYYVGPALLALAVVALRPPAAQRGTVATRLTPPATRLSPRLAVLLSQDPQAELGLLHQGELGVLFEPGARGGWLVGRAPGALVALLDPFGAARLPALLPDLARAARDAGRVPCLYKISARRAVEARAAGWLVAPIAEELWLDPARFRLDLPARSGLRRKLRKPERAGVVVQPAPEVLPIAAMQALARDWARAHGGERGFSMGRFAPDYLAQQRVFLAWQGERLVAFVSFHANRHEWVLDLLRPAPGVPDGTMQALILAALAAARAEGAARLSLAALPPDPDLRRGGLRLLWRLVARQSGAAGLRQFKAGFAPRSAPRYIAAPGPLALARAALALSRAIGHPPPLPPPGRMQRIQDDHEQKEFALSPPPWQEGADP